MTADVRQTFARRVRERRQAAGITQQQLGQLAGEHGAKPLGQTAITRLESGRRPVTLEEAVALADALACPVSHLLDRHGVTLDEAFRSVRIDKLNRMHREVRERLRSHGGFHAPNA